VRDALKERPQKIVTERGKWWEDQGGKYNFLRLKAKLMVRILAVV
jgi:hypothetical protein